MNYSKNNSISSILYKTVLCSVLASTLWLAGCSSSPSKNQSAGPATAVAPSQLKTKYQSAITQMQSNNTEKAYQSFTALTVEYPTYSGPYINLGIIHLKRQQLDKAEDFFKQAIAVNDSSFEGHNQLAILYRKNGDFSGAEKHYLKAKQIDDSRPELHRNIAILYDLYMGKLPQALTHYQQYKQLSPNPDPALRGWIIDIENRIKTQNRQALNSPG